MAELFAALSILKALAEKHQALQNNFDDVKFAYERCLKALSEKTEEISTLKSQNEVLKGQLDEIVKAIDDINTKFSTESPSSSSGSAEKDKGEKKKFEEFVEILAKNKVSIEMLHGLFSIPNVGVYVSPGGIPFIYSENFERVSRFFGYKPAECFYGVAPRSPGSSARFCHLRISNGFKVDLDIADQCTPPKGAVETVFAFDNQRFARAVLLKE